jgi:hypothetical protein
VRIKIIETDKAMHWYKTLDINKRINLKELCPTICGVDFQEIGCMFTLDERIGILYHKLQLEGFDI